MSGFVDLQVNGYGGIDFNSDNVTVAEIEQACVRLRSAGTHAFLPTIITADLDAMCRRISQVVDAIESSSLASELVAGIHVEGPFISREPGYVGAHPVAAVCDASIDAVSRLLDAGRGYVRLVTLAPEVNGAARVIQFLTDQGIVVSGGHSNASIDQLCAGLDAGMAMFTHLGNGCPVTMHRHDNIINRVLSLADRMMISLIADGHHVPWFAMRNYLNSIPESNVVIVTDAISAAGLGPGKHRLGDQWVEVDESLAAWGEGRKQFAGCATEMNQMSAMLASNHIATPEQVHRWTTENPGRVLKGVRYLF
ncbi:N-acetylglucosamine-6-phosphate deacetylase [Rhodopirellula sp. MGV]|uniref:N-acetylglucosamine-6-phosphate deacetylase n=1 Tax=Rhodopirellula sp. MGV TaxID=2023130 RepID=UPI000B96F640|nr:N-acetylglucosamine-6-phosphate deacetylase [Rhodopirellula sp. MGV]OYP28352.1 N-acetylglucosamine-6-phosphate deacetylase [Rhodopirellula sp. MGV]PNY38772.1 N-acetylglucosamine-6-phosphate deacetylase [Rhodopirellula baltica]